MLASAGSLLIASAQLGARHLGHHHVGEHEVGRALAHRREALAPVARHAHAELLRHQVVEQPPHVDVVFHHEHLGRAGRMPRMAGRASRRASLSRRAPRCAPARRACNRSPYGLRRRAPPARAPRPSPPSRSAAPGRISVARLALDRLGHRVVVRVALAPRQHHVHLRAAPEPMALGPHAPAVQLHQLLHERQADARALVLPRVRRRPPARTGRRSARADSPGSPRPCPPPRCARRPAPRARRARGSRRRASVNFSALPSRLTRIFSNASGIGVDLGQLLEPLDLERHALALGERPRARPRSRSRAPRAAPAAAAPRAACSRSSRGRAGC